MKLHEQTITNALILILLLIIFFRVNFHISIYIPNLISYTTLEGKLVYDGKLISDTNISSELISLEYISKNKNISFREYLINPLADSVLWQSDSTFIVNLLTDKHWEYINKKRNNHKFIPHAVYVNNGYSKRLNDTLHLYHRFMTQSYVRNVYKLAKLEEIKTKKLRGNGIPITITLAQGILESNSGLSDLASKYHNHFGVKCPGYNDKVSFRFTGFREGDCDECLCVNKRDDSSRDLFRVNETIEQSYQQHTKVLMYPRYKKCFKYKSTDYKNWARAIHKAGYATDTQYSNKLIKIIETVRLNKL